MDNEINTEFTDSQKRAFSQLKTAFKACDRAGLIVWDNYGSIAAVNGKVIAKILTCYIKDEWDATLDEVETMTISPKCLHGAVSDDSLGVEFRRDI